jgi:hypothetical protein
MISHAISTGVIKLFHIQIKGNIKKIFGPLQIICAIIICIGLYLTGIKKAATLP